MKLVIVESPKKSETITRYLGGDFKVLASEGHIRDLSMRGKGGLGIDIEKGFKADWEISESKKAVVAKLQKATKEADEVYLATDPDREGEAISWHLAQVLHLPVKTTPRLQFHEITKPAIVEAMANPKRIDMNLVRAQETRRMEDRIIGFKVSSLLQRNIKIQSAGRVQSSTLKMIVDRHNAIQTFVPEEYWTIEVEIELGGKKFKANLIKVDGKPFHCKSKAKADAILARMPKILSITSVSKVEKSIAPKMPFTTSTMQQEAFNKFKFSNSKTQSVAQKLYEGKTVNGDHVGLITYMRTDSTRLSPRFFNAHAVPFIMETYGKEYLGTLRQTKESSKKIQDAHEAIRPTGTHRTPEAVAPFLSPDEAKLYRLIYCRAMASVMAPKRIESTSLILSGNGLDFSLSGSRTLFKGFTIVYGEFDDEEEASLPEVKQGEELKVEGVFPDQKFTKPEPPYNEASIVKAMEEKGIGRPSTYASTIDTLSKRKYISTTKGVITPTESGIKATTVLEKYFPDIVSSDYTATMESQLDLVEAGKTNFETAMKDFYEPFMAKFEQAKTLMYKEPAEETGELCPVCGKPLVVKKTRKGDTFIGCSGYPECTYIKKKEKKPEEEVGELCPDCGKPLVYKKNKKGERFIGCSGFPTCHYTRNPNAKEKKPKKEVCEADHVKPCPQCKTGFLIVKKGRKAEFLGCTNFPRCRYHEWLSKKEKK